jgi:hypothetical protein
MNGIAPPYPIAEFLLKTDSPQMLKVLFVCYGIHIFSKLLLQFATKF